MNTKLAARKRPTQNRSAKTVDKILEATRQLLKETGGASSKKITTNHIAQRAGVSVGSLYQYYPNTEAIIFDLYQDMLGRIQAIMDKYDSPEYLALPKEEFFQRFNLEMTDADSDTDFVFEMLRASRIYPMLTEAGNKHADLLAVRIAGFMKHYGSKWPMKKLEQLALYLFYVDEGTWMYRDHSKAPKKQTLQWENRILNFMVMQCFD